MSHVYFWKYYFQNHHSRFPQFLAERGERPIHCSQPTSIRDPETKAKNKQKSFKEKLRLFSNEHLINRALTDLCKGSSKYEGSECPVISSLYL
jgi:hypothetical protein